MNLTEKLKSLQDNHLGEWILTRDKVAKEFSENQPTFCICGKLASGLHESNCRRLSNAITKETVKRMFKIVRKK